MNSERTIQGLPTTGYTVPSEHYRRKLSEKKPSGRLPLLIALGVGTDIFVLNTIFNILQKNTLLTVVSTLLTLAVGSSVAIGIRNEYREGRSSRRTLPRR